jgi:protein-tyrosine-phosphatase
MSSPKNISRDSTVLLADDLARFETRSKKILFACTLNSVRSPMAAAILKKLQPTWHVDSVGVAVAGIDPFVVAVLEEQEIYSVDHHEAKAFDEIPATAIFHETIALSAPAADLLEHGVPFQTGAVHFWDFPMPDAENMNRDQCLMIYRLLRDAIGAKIRQHFDILFA